jgi:hypothetical protein
MSSSRLGKKARGLGGGGGALSFKGLSGFTLTASGGFTEEEEGQEAWPEGYDSL